jgi:hypothetical protein
MRFVSLARLAAAAAVALVIGAAPRPAAADGTYFNFGMGPADVRNELGQYTDNAFHIHLGVGHRFGNLAVEAFLAGDVADDGSRFQEANNVGVDLKYIVRLSDNFQGYVRGRASRMDLTMDGGGYNECFDCYGFGRDYAGRGLGAGAGLMLRGKVRAIGFLYWPLFFVPAGPKVNASLYIDHGMDFYRLHASDGASTIDAELHRWTFGFTVGKDF